MSHLHRRSAGSETTMVAAISTAVPSSIFHSDSATVAGRDRQETGIQDTEIRVPLVRHPVIRPLQRQRQLIGWPCGPLAASGDRPGRVRRAASPRPPWRRRWLTGTIGAQVIPEEQQLAEQDDRR